MVKQVKHQQETCVLIGAGFTAKRLIPQLLRRNMRVIATCRSAESQARLRALGAQAVIYQSGAPGDLIKALKRATHIISSVPPKDGTDRVIADLGGTLAKHSPALRWAGYLSATSVYGDREGQWAFEDEPLYPLTTRGRARIEAELAWLETGAPVHVLRLAGIYGPGRNPFGKIISGKARAVIKPGHIVNRIHVDDIVSAILASMDAPDPAQVYNIADGNPAPPQDVLSYAADLIGAARPKRVAHDTAEISDMARSFYVETKAIDITRAKVKLGWTPKYADYKSGLTAIKAEENVTAIGVTLSGYIDVPAPDLSAVQAALPEHIRLTQDEPGCLGFSCTQDAKLPTRYHVYERFETESAFKAHQVRAGASHWASASKTAIRHYLLNGEPI